MGTERTKIWVTRYALSSGISEIEDAEISDGLATYKVKGWTNYVHGEGKEWHRTKEASLAQADAMRIRKIAALRKQIAKLEALRFE